MTTTLALLQHALTDHIRRGGTGMAGHVRAAPGLGASGLAAPARLAVYQDAYRLRTAEALRADFPALLARLGRDSFDALAGRYLARCPSTSHTLRDLGAGFAAYLRSARPYRDARHLAELAAFEWALRAAFDAPDAPVLDAQALAALGPALVRYTPRPHPGARSLALRWNTLPTWRAASAGAVLPEAARLHTATACVVWRRDQTVHFRTLAADEAAALRAASRGRDFSAMCHTLARFLGADAVPARAATLLATWAQEGLLAAAPSP